MRPGVSGYQDSPLGWVAKPVVALGALLLAVAGIGWQIETEFIQWFGYHAVGILGILACLALMVLCAVGIFTRSLTLNLAIGVLAGWAVALSYHHLTYYYVFTDEQGFSYWYHFPLFIGMVIAGFGVLMLVASTWLGLGRQALVIAKPSAVSIAGRVLLVAGAFLALLTAFLFLLSWASRDFTTTTVFGLLLAIVAIGAAVGTIWRSWPIADLAVAMIPGWLAAFAGITVQGSLFWFYDLFEGDAYIFGFWLSWKGTFGVIGNLLLLVAAVLLSIAAVVRIRILEGTATDSGSLGATAHSQTVPPAGWYPDPSGVASMRWWNGIEWTSDVHEQSKIGS